MVIELLKIRNADWGVGSSNMPWMPNELMFEIFANLFQMYNNSK